MASCITYIVLMAFHKLLLSQELNIDDVDKTMDEISEAQDQMQQMNDVLSQPIGTAADLDEDELAAELAVCILSDKYAWAVVSIKNAHVSSFCLCCPIHIRRWNLLQPLHIEQEKHCSCLILCFEY